MPCGRGAIGEYQGANIRSAMMQESAAANAASRAGQAKPRVEDPSPSSGISQSQGQVNAVADAPAPVERQILTRRGGTTVWVTKSTRPWTLPLDAFVVPVSPGGAQGGQLVKTLLDDLHARHPDLEIPSLKGPGRITPEVPVALPRSDTWAASGLPARLILATAGGPERSKRASGENWTARNAGVAARAIVRLAASQGCARIAIPLLGSGAGRVRPDQVAEEVLYGILDALPADPVREITLVTLDDLAIATLADRTQMRSQSFANDLPAGQDLLNVEAEAILLRDLEPPLVVGVLGGWGSGKSFVMHLMRERISEIRALPIEDKEMAWPEDRAKRFPYVGHPYVITFDAWTYANADLWASLMQTVFGELSRQLTLEAQLKDAGANPLLGGNVWKALALMNDPERTAILEAAKTDKDGGFLKGLPKNGELSDTLWTWLGKLKNEQTTKLETARNKRFETEAQLAQARQQLDAALARRLAEETRRAAWRTVAAQAGAVLRAALRRLAPEAEAFGPKDSDQLKDARNQVLFVERLWSGPRLQVLAFAAFIALAGAGAWLATREHAATYKWLTVAVAAAGTLWRTLKRWEGWFANLSNDYQRQQQAEVAKIPSRRDAILAELPETKAVATLERDARVQRAEEVAWEERIGTPAGFVSLAEFVQTRLDASSYESKLGLMHQVQKDIASLSDCLVVYDQDEKGPDKRLFFPRGPARVILFIDDLDRCPPEQVVAVLEAVQLLVKTRLFVVVLAMDVRYVTRALEKRYEKILWRHGDPSGLDYIEKIVQIPYRVRPIDANAFAPFVRSQMHVTPRRPVVTGLPGAAHDLPEGNAPPPPPPPPPPADGGDLPLTTKVLEFSPEEYDIVRDCCALVELSPRSVKRVVNVYKLLKIVWYRGARYVEPGWDVKRAVVTLLALAARHPEPMRDLLDELSHATATGERASLSAWLRRHCQTHVKNERQSVRWMELALSLQRQDRALDGVTVSKLGAPSCNLVRSFSFLGDIGAEPDEILSTGGNRGNHQDAQKVDGARLDRRRQQPRRVRAQ